MSYAGLVYASVYVFTETQKLDMPDLMAEMTPAWFFFGIAAP
jgi:hypothetical protein